MPHRLRVLAPDTVYHLTQRGIDRMPVFHTPQDHRVYLQYMQESLSRRSCRLHAYCLMTNHVHLMVSAEDPEDISRLMEEVQGRYSRYFNLTWHRTGSLWQRRFRCTEVASDEHLIRCFQYLDMNPVKGRRVSRPEHYAWSIYRALALGDAAPILALHPCYLDLGEEKAQRQGRYRDRLEEFLDQWKRMGGLQ